MNDRHIRRSWKAARIGAGVLAVLLVFSGEVWMLCHPRDHVLRRVQKPESAESYPNQDIYLPPW